MSKSIRVLLCDDSPLMRRLLAKMLSADPGIEVVGECENGEQALAKIEELAPDVVLLDLVMPVMDGVETLKQARERKLNPAFVVVSAKAAKAAPITLDALKEGAVDFVTKAPGMLQMESISSEVVAKVRSAAEARARTLKPKNPTPGPAAAPGATSAPEARAPSRAGLSVLGGSAGCMQALPGILSALPEKLSGCLVLVLKLPPFLTKQIPIQFGKTCPIPIELATNGMALQAGRLYIAPGGDANLTFERDPTGKRVQFKVASPNEKSDEGCPSIDAAMQSAAKLFRDSTRGILISGTGKDGLEGLRAILSAGGETVVQDRGSTIAPQLVIAAHEQSLAQRSLSAVDIASLFKIS